jgi:alkylation response protein AidB-like acyl-CoA dehydrogenase
MTEQPENRHETHTDAAGSATALMLADLSDLANRHKQEGDNLRRLPPALADAFLQHDVYRLILPRDLGGAGVGPLEYLRLIEQLARTDGSIAWNFAIGAGSAVYGGYLPLERSRVLFAEAKCCIAGAYAPIGRAEIVPGGYRVSGRWGWASGVHQARWMVLGFTIVSPDEAQNEGARRPEMRQALAPREAFRVLDSWHVSGMRGTGSAEYEVNDLFIPAEDTFQVFKEKPHHPAPIFHMPGVFFAAAVASVPLGIAQGAADSLKQLAMVKQASRGRSSLRDHAFAHYAVAKAEALAESGSAFLHQAMADVWRGVQAGDAIDLARRARARRACVHAAEASAEAVDLCCRAAGGHALFQSQAFERALRDVRAAAAHIVLQRSAMEDVGRVTFGLEPLSPVF